MWPTLLRHSPPFCFIGRGSEAHSGAVTCPRSHRAVTVSGGQSQGRGPRGPPRSCVWGSPAGAGGREPLSSGGSAPSPPQARRRGPDGVSLGREPALSLGRGMSHATCPRRNGGPPAPASSRSAHLCPLSSSPAILHHPTLHACLLSSPGQATPSALAAPSRHPPSWPFPPPLFPKSWTPFPLPGPLTLIPQVPGPPSGSRVPPAASPPPWPRPRGRGGRSGIARAPPPPHENVTMPGPRSS